MKVIENILIKVSPDRLFSYLMDVDNRKNYIPALEKVIMLDPKPIREGSRYIEVANIAGKRLETNISSYCFGNKQTDYSTDIEKCFSYSS